MSALSTEPRSTGERFVYEVPSSNNPRICYRVDLVNEGGYGRCSCTDWNTRRWPNIKDKLPMGTRDTLCKHVAKARNHFLNALLVELAAKEDQS